MFRFVVAPNLSLRLLEFSHTYELFALTDQNREHLRQWLPWLDHVKSTKDTRAFIDICRKQLAENTGLQAGIWWKSRLAGMIGFHQFEWSHRRACIGYWLASEFQGQGIITRSCSALLDYAFDQLDLNRVEIRCAPENHRSRAVPQRLGFTEEGRCREAEWLYDHFVDHIVYSMLAREWKEVRVPPEAMSVSWPYSS